MTLFEIKQELQNCLLVDEDTGEVNFDQTKFDALMMEQEAKYENLANWIINMKSDIDQLAQQIKVFQERKKAIENKLESVKGFLSRELNGEKRNFNTCQISWRKSESVVVDDITKLQDYYKPYVPEVDKVAIKKVFGQGFEVDGCHLESKNSIQIK